MASVPGVLDFIVPYILFNVQSATLAHPLWTSAYLNSASTSNPPCLLIPFGLPRAVSPLQRPIHRVSTSPTKGSRILRSSRRKAEVHRTSCAPVQKPGYAMFYPLIRLPSGQKEKGSEEAHASSLPFSYGPEGSRTPVRKPIPCSSTIIVDCLTFPPVHENQHPCTFSSFMIRPASQSFDTVVSYMFEAWVLKCRCFKSDCCN